MPLVLQKTDVIDLQLAGHTNEVLQRRTALVFLTSIKIVAVPARFAFSFVCMTIKLRQIRLLRVQLPRSLI